MKANGTTVTYANAGIGAASHLCGLLFMSAIGAKVTEVPYDGTGPAMEDLLGEQVDFMCDQTTNTTDADQGRRRSRPMPSPARSATTPCPMCRRRPRAGCRTSQSACGTASTCRRTRLTRSSRRSPAALKAALTDANVIAKFAELGTLPVAEDQATPEAHTAKLQAQIELWKPIIEAAGREPRSATADGRDESQPSRPPWPQPSPRRR